MNKQERKIRKAIITALIDIEDLGCTVDTSGFMDDDMILITFQKSDKDESDITLQLDAQVY